MTEIFGYKLLGELSPQNAGFCKWGFCEKKGRVFFIKEFLSPVYPADTKELSERVIERKKKICTEFFAAKAQYYEILNTCRTGNNVLILQFFRSGTKFYIITDKVESDGTDPRIIAALSNDKKEAVIRSLLYSISKIHNAGLVHADLKPDNILLKKTHDGFYAAKIIDFDSGFIVGHVPANLQGDFVYLAPETYLKINEEDVNVTEKIDIFALGILIHQYWTGELPSTDSKYNYLFEAAIDGGNIYLSDQIPQGLKKVISRMLSADPSKRPPAETILKAYQIRDDRSAEHYSRPVKDNQKDLIRSDGFHQLDDSEL